MYMTVPVTQYPPAPGDDGYRFFLTLEEAEQHANEQINSLREDIYRVDIYKLHKEILTVPTHKREDS